MAGNGAASPQRERQQAFLNFVRAHESELRGFARCRVGSEHVTQDIVQTTFLSAWTDANFDPTHPHARAWVFKRARWLILDWRRSDESNSMSLDDLSERAERDRSRGSQSAVPVDRKARDPLALMIDEERYRKLDVALSMLSNDEREALERYYLRKDGTQYNIAQSLGLTLAAFNSRLNRARKELKRLILKVRGHDGESPDGHDSRKS